MSYYGFKPYVPVAKRRAQAAREMEKLRKKGQTIAPVVIEGRTITKNFWGKAWCTNLERYSDFENRLPRGRTYARNGSVVDLQANRGRIQALVMGSNLYTVKIDIGALPAARWLAICNDCAGSVGSLVELLSGKLSKNVMERVCREGEGLFPTPREIKMSCSCPDGARMCKHVAGALYGMGARLDAEPGLLFALRGVDQSDLINLASADFSIPHSAGAGARVLADDDLGALFGVEMAVTPAAPKTRSAKRNVGPVTGQAAAKDTKVGKQLEATAPTLKKPKTKALTSGSLATASKEPPTKARASKSVPVHAGAAKAAPSRKTIQPASQAQALFGNKTAALVRREDALSMRRVRTRAARWIKQ